MLTRLAQVSTRPVPHDGRAAARKLGHEVDAIDLYRDGFDPVMSEAERLNYHDLELNRRPVEDYVERLLKAEALVLVYPVWNYGFPAILKGWIDRVFLPGVSFGWSTARCGRPCTTSTKLVVVTTYGGSRLRTWLMGDPPRKLANRMLRATDQAGRTGHLSGPLRNESRHR
jgi:NAD(P)H dehydrogenase (quinone)